jgi:hypothetical protein
MEDFECLSNGTTDGDDEDYLESLREHERERMVLRLADPNRLVDVRLRLSATGLQKMEQEPSWGTLRLLKSFGEFTADLTVIAYGARPNSLGGQAGDDPFKFVRERDGRTPWACRLFDVRPVDWLERGRNERGKFTRIGMLHCRLGDLEILKDQG